MRSSRLWDADAFEGVVFLETLGGEVGHDEREHVAYDGGKVAPCQTLALHEIDHGAYESEVPVVPQVDVDGARGLGEHHQGVDAQADGYDECTHGGVVGHGGGGGPAHVEDVEL